MRGWHAQSDCHNLYDARLTRTIRLPQPQTKPNKGGYEWSRECAEAGDALCQYTYGWRIHLHPTMSQEMKDSMRGDWMRKSAEGGFAQAMFTTGRSHLGSQNYTGAIKLFKAAIASGEGDASYQLAQLVLAGVVEPSEAALEYAALAATKSDAAVATASTAASQKGERGRLIQAAAERDALEMIEVTAAVGASPHGGAPKAMYNLGIAWLYGFAGSVTMHTGPSACTYVHDGIDR